MEIKFNYVKKNIEDVKIGDYVKSFNIETLTNEPRRVLNTFRPEVLEPSRIDFIDGGYIINSKKHPILVKRANEYLYKEFDDILVGDVVLKEDGTETLVHKKTPLEYKKMNFYDIEVDHNNNFYAGFVNQYCNHNSSNLFLPFYHYEVELFSQLGDSRGTVETRARHTDQSIILNKWFLEKALNKEDIYLFHMHKVPKLYKRLGNYEEFNKWYNTYAESVPDRNKKKVNAFELLKLFLFERSITGRVYFTFADNCYKTGAFKETVYSSNLCCLAGDTMISTPTGLRMIKDIKVGDEVLSFNEETQEVEVKKVLNSLMTSPSREVIEIEYNGRKIVCTPDHRILTKRGYVEAQYLSSDDELIIY